MTPILAVQPPWTSVLTDGEHALVLFAVTGAALALLATLVRVRFSAAEVQGEYRTASLTANAVVALALAAYVLVLGAVLLGYGRTAAGWVPNEYAVLAWAFRYVDWSITVPLLVLQLLSISMISTPARAARLRAAGMALAFAMILLGFLGAFVVGDGRDFAALLLLGVLSSVCFLGLAVVVIGVALRTLPRLPESARGSYRSSVLVLVVVWFVYPIVYGLQGITSGGGWAVTGAVALSVADVVAKVGFGSLVHRTAVLRSRADEDASPSTQRRPRQPEADTLWVGDHARYDRDPDLRRD
jgi:bacteriorhodopsin